MIPNEPTAWVCCVLIVSVTILIIYFGKNVSI